MSVIYEEQGAEIGVKEQEMAHIVHYVMRYILKDGDDLSKEMTDLAIPVLKQVERREDSGYTARISALHLLALIHQYRGEQDLQEAAEERQRIILLGAEQEATAEIDVAYV